MEQMTMFDFMYPRFQIDRPIRLIELFSGVSSQAMALRDLGADFEHYLTCEWEINAVASCKAIHFPDDNTDYSKEYTEDELIDILCNMGISANGKEALTKEQIQNHNFREKWLRETYNNIKATHNIVNIMAAKGSDLRIVDTDKYIYLLTYSFPCQDLSLAGKRKGMTKGSGTRSGLLWEVERLLNETEHLPQILLMENVPQVMSDDNINDFHGWCSFLESKGYKCYSEILNAKDYGVAQNRERAFMISVLGEYNYKFPQPIPLQKTMKDYLEPEVDERYYINTDKAKKLIQDLIESGKIGNKGTAKPNEQNKEQYPISAGNCIKPKPIDNGMCLTARYYKGLSNYNPKNAVFERNVKEDGRTQESGGSDLLSDTR